MHKEEIMSIIHKLFQKINKGELLSESFYQTNINLRPKSNRHYNKTID